MSKHILIITYYWPPAGGAGVQRWLKFVKYLPDHGWTPVIYTVKNGEFPVLDFSLEKDIPEGTEVIRRKIFEPYNWYKKFIGQKPQERINAGFLSQTEKPAGKEKLSRWIRGNLFIPDARKFWIRPSVRFLSKYLKEHPVDLIISTGPPHSMHLIALGLKKKLHIPWLADFRDPWTKIDFYDELHLSNTADRKHHQLEKQVVRSANTVVSVTRYMQKDFEQLGARNSVYIPNGYDPADIPADISEKIEKFRILYIGSLNETRNPGSLWHVLRQLTTEEPGFTEDLRIELIGKTDISVHRSIEQSRLTPFVSMTDYVPHEEIFRLQKKAAILLLLINKTRYDKGIVTGKIFEYLISGRPVLAIGPPDGEAATILKQTNTGVTVNYDDEKALKKAITEFYHQYKTGALQVKPKHIEDFSRKTLTIQLTNQFEKLLTQSDAEKTIHKPHF